jgi:hypothetical protein
MPERDELDRLIDAELSRYAEPRAGLEQRILARIDTEPPARFRIFGAWERWALAGAIAAAIILSIGVPLSMRQNGTTVSTAGGRATHSREPISANMNVPATHPEVRLSKQPDNSAQRTPRRSRTIEVTQHATLPKLDLFPTLQPLSESEHVVTRFAVAASKTQRKSLLIPSEEIEEPIRITAIHIPPLPSLEEDTN